MKLHQIIGVCAISLSLLGLFGCEANNASEPEQTQHTSHDSASKTGTNESGQTNQTGQNPKDPATDDSASGDQSEQSNNTNQNSSENQTGSLNPNKPPQTTQEALKEIVEELNTRVPLMVPTNIPVEQGKYLTATTTSEKWHYQINLYETNQPVYINSHEASKGAPIAKVEGTEYQDDTSANKAIIGYIQAEPSQNASDLGHGIKADIEGAAGHSYIIWNEGRWCIKVDSPNDPAYQNKQYPDGKKLAEKVVAYLSDHALPAPQKNGVITIYNWNQTPRTTIQWQFHEMTYQITSSDPLKPIEIAVTIALK